MERHPVWIIKSEMLPKLARLFPMEQGVRKILLRQEAAAASRSTRPSARMAKRKTRVRLSTPTEIGPHRAVLSPGGNEYKQKSTGLAYNPALY
jgi:hypothetical protein